MYINFCTLTMVKKMTFLKGNLQMYIAIHLRPLYIFEIGLSALRCKICAHLC